MKRARPLSNNTVEEEETHPAEKLIKPNERDIEEEGNNICWEIMPPELRARIYTLLAAPPHYTYVLVCKEWNEQIPNYFHSVTSLNLAPFSSCINDEVLEYVSTRFCKIQKLILGKIGTNMPLTEGGMRSLANFTKVTSLNLIDCKLSCSIIKALAAHLPMLHTLNMTWCSMHDDCVSHFSLFSHLTHLSLQNSSHISDTGLMQLKDLRQLTSLNLSFCCKISDYGIMKVVEKLQDIQSLNLSWCSEITDLSLLHIGNNLQKLRVLYLTGCRKISMDGKNFIRRSLPECKVYSDSNYIPFKIGVNM